MKNSLPLSLYIHIPWCIKKCPYCDFNSHQQKGSLPESLYIDHLLQDLQVDLHRFKHQIHNRSLHSIFIGGGTPSLFQPDSIARLLQSIKTLIPFSPNIEITLEANPATAEVEKFTGFVNAGITRLSIGVQSFDDEKLQQLGRVHQGSQAKNAIGFAKNLLGKGLKSFNIDLMHGLPNQTLANALDDLRQAIALNPPHISWYQLTIEPNTLFASRPPTLPDDDELWAIFEQGDKLLCQAGYQQYETSAYAKVGFQCKHNLNYWRFGDYLAIGCGAHGKISDISRQGIGNICRFSKTKHPQGYLQGQYLFEEKCIEKADRSFEFFMNRFRLLEPVPKSEFMAYTGLALSSIQKEITQAKKQGYILEDMENWQITTKGKLFLNELLTHFLKDG